MVDSKATIIAASCCDCEGQSPRFMKNIIQYYKSQFNQRLTFFLNKNLVLLTNFVLYQITTTTLQARLDKYPSI